MIEVQIIVFFKGKPVEQLRGVLGWASHLNLDSSRLCTEIPVSHAHKYLSRAFHVELSGRYGGRSGGETACWALTRPELSKPMAEIGRHTKALLAQESKGKKWPCLL